MYKRFKLLQNDLIEPYKIQLYNIKSLLTYTLLFQKIQYVNKDFGNE